MHEGKQHLVSVFPAWSGIRAVMSGSVLIDLKTGKVSLQGQNDDQLSSSLNSLKRDRFRSALVYCDQPSSIKIDGIETFPQVVGLQSIKGVDMLQSLEINSYLMQAVAVIFSTSEEPPIIPDVGTFDFRRAATTSAYTSTSYTALQLRPYNIDWARGTTFGVPYKNDIFSSTVNVGEEAPYTGMLGKKTFIVRNTGSNALNFKLQGIFEDGDNFDDLPVTGPLGIAVDVGDSAIVHLDKPYYRIRFVSKSLSGAAVALAVRMTAKFGNGGG